jgi:hypothetical protein
MPKSKPSKSCYLKQIVAEFGDDIFSTDGHVSYSKMCDTKVVAENNSRYNNISAATSIYEQCKFRTKKICANITATVFI